MASLRDSKYDKELNYIAQLGAFLLKRMQHSAILTGTDLAELRRHYGQIAAGRLRLIHRSPYCCSVGGQRHAGAESIRVEHM